MELGKNIKPGTILVPNSKYGDPKSSVAFSYEASKDTRYRKRKEAGIIRSEERELDMHDRNRIIATLLQFRRDNPVVKGIMRLRRTDVVGSGIKAYPKTGDKEYDKQILDLWNEFEESPEVTGEWTMTDIQKFLTESTLFFGDCGLIFTKSGKLQAIEGCQVGEPIGAKRYISSELDRNRQGVVLGSMRQPIAYKIGVMDGSFLRDVQEYNASNVAFHYKKHRASQVRGIPELASVLDDLQDIDEWDDIEMLSAKIASALSVFVKKTDAVQWEIGNRQIASEQDSVGRLEAFDPASINYLEPGEDIGIVSPNGRPNTDAIKYLIYRFQKIGTAVGIPVEFLLQTIGDSSFSASQGVVLQYQQSITEEQRELTKTLKKIYNWKVGRWLMEGKIKNPPTGVDPFKVSWQPQGFRWINRSAQVDADRSYLQMGAMSLDDVTAQFGKTASMVQDQIENNINEAMIRADKINKTLPPEQPKVTWLQFYNPYQTSGSFAMPMQSAIDAAMNQIPKTQVDK
jgi:lambda family phage portal protein